MLSDAQLPSGLGNGGLLNFAATTDNSQASFESGFAVAQQLITVAIGLVVGLFCSTAVMYPCVSSSSGYAWSLADEIAQLRKAPWRSHDFLEDFKKGGKGCALALSEVGPQRIHGHFQLGASKRL